MPGRLRRHAQWGEIKGVELEWCPACGGVWFDRGEVGRLLKHYRRAMLPGATAGRCRRLGRSGRSRRRVFDLFS